MIAIVHNGLETKSHDAMKTVTLSTQFTTLLLLLHFAENLDENGKIVADFESCCIAMGGTLRYIAFMNNKDMDSCHIVFFNAPE